MRRTLRLLSGAFVAALLAVGFAMAASAHAVIPAGRYHVAIGWEYEPVGSSVTYVGQLNGVQVFVDTLSASGGIGSPVSDLNADCTHPDMQVTVTYAGVTSSPLCPQSAYDPDTRLGRQDEYDAVMTPTRVGNYTFRIFGSIHGTAIDKSVTSGPSTFDTVGDQSAVEFPTAAPALSEVATKIDQVGIRAADAASSAQKAANSAGTATTVAIIAIVVAVVLSLSNLALLRRRR